MIREYTCPSCGSNLSLIQGKNIFECSFCGEIYSDKIRKIDIALIEEMKDKKMLVKARNYTLYLLEKEPDNWKLQWEKLTCKTFPNLPSAYIRSHSILPLGFDFHGFKTLIPNELQHYVDDLLQLDLLHNSIRDLENAAEADYRKYARATSRVRRSAYDQGPSGILRDLIFWTIWAVFLVLFLIFSIKYQAWLTMVPIVVIPIVYCVGIDRSKDRKGMFLSDVELMKQIVEDYDKKKIQYKEEIEKLRKESEELLVSVKKDEEEIRKLMI